MFNFGETEKIWELPSQMLYQVFRRPDFADFLEPGGRLIPYVALGRRVTLQVNFGKDKFAHPQDGYNMLHCFLSEKEISKLSQLFNHYKGNLSDSL